MQAKGAMFMKIVILDGHALNPGDLDWGCLDQFGEVTLYDRTATEAEAIARSQGAQILLTNKTPITPTLLDACPSVKLVCVLATGYNVVDTAAAKARGIPVCNVPSYGTDAVAQYTFALLLELCHQIGLHNTLVHQGRWSQCPDFCFWATPQMELTGKTMGIIGFGKIGRAVGRIARAFGMNVLAYSRSQCDEGESIGSYVELDDLLRRSDVVSLHCPLFPETREIINEQTTARLKDGGALLNNARAPLIAEGAGARARGGGRARRRGGGVVTREPIPKDSPLLTAPNCIITPHMAWAPTESRERLLTCVADNIRAFLEGHPQNVVNP